LPSRAGMLKSRKDLGICEEGDCAVGMVISGAGFGWEAMESAEAESEAEPDGCLLPQPSVSARAATRRAEAKVRMVGLLLDGGSGGPIRIGRIVYNRR
jgi:hypothetical protein